MVPSCHLLSVKLLPAVPVLSVGVGWCIAVTVVLAGPGQGPWQVQAEAAGQVQQGHLQTACLPADQSLKATLQGIGCKLFDS